MAVKEPVIDKPLEPRRAAIIIGASTGFGAALAEEAAGRGIDLGLISRNRDRLAKLAAQLEGDHGVQVFHYEHDVRHTGEIPELFQRAVRDLGRLDYFIFNSGIMHKQDPERFEAEEDIETLEVNLVGAAAWLMPVAERFARAGQGHIVGVGSIAGERGRRALPAYSASKAGLHTYLEALRNRLSGKGVVVTTIKPGQMQTAMLERAEAIRGPIPVEQAARQAWRAILSGKQIVYIPSRWALVALIIRNIPSFIFRRLNL
ncbi:MAG: SDR family NAD(P)-dependent oxidoreductase [Anaerolineales bacterium]